MTSHFRTLFTGKTGGTFGEDYICVLIYSNKSFCYLEINTSFQLEKENKQYNVTAFKKATSSFLKEDIFLYKDNLEQLTGKLLLLENIDFRLSNNGKVATEITSHAQMSRPPAAKKDSLDQDIQDQETQHQDNQRQVSILMKTITYLHNYFISFQRIQFKFC